MMSDNFFKLKTTIDTKFHHRTIDNNVLTSYKAIIKDGHYFRLIDAIGNGGFFFNSSVHLYGYSTAHDFHSIDYVNQFLKQEYGNIVGGLVFFGQDIFGNQFGFNEHNSKIIFFNIETGDREIIANDIEDWVSLIFDEVDYFTGHKLSVAWRIRNNLDFNERLCPKIPFILNGDYTIANLYASPFPQYLRASANIARQVYNLPDGSNFKITIRKED